ncbi:GDSL esterase/lipase EXL3 isoform X1 [Raphanus sativus]|uniref:GDSL esterase/lipase EXL3 isoform X1 n=1 Tax=Raphanus sativus TaxID=3726 RepID=A0A9W3C4K7_RAPSA|nr:GDSL esterase/lipase EXL3 isoform X1 [Raphanus sativus]
MKDNTSWSCSCFSVKLCLLSLLFLTETLVAIKLPPNLKFPALIAFGDSIVDTGNNNNVKTVVKSDFQPYGINFQGGVPTGRFCDGRVPTDLIAEELGIKSVVPAYLDPSLKTEDILTGVSFASGGSGYDPLTPKLVAVISLEEQLKYFEEYIEKVKNIVGEERKGFILANSLFLLVAGSDDIANTYYVLRARPNYDADSYTTLMANSATDFVNKLYGYGVRRIAVFGAPPLGCVPSQRTLGGGLLRECAENYNEAAKLFNSKISAKLDLLHKTLPGIKPVYINIYDPLLNIIQSPAKYGFEVSNKGCCGTGLVEVAVLCNKITSSLARPILQSLHYKKETNKRLILSCPKSTTAIRHLHNAMHKYIYVKTRTFSHKIMAGTRPKKEIIEPRPKFLTSREHSHMRISSGSFMTNIRTHYALIKLYTCLESHSTGNTCFDILPNSLSLKAACYG